jgi:ribonuclease HII
MPRHRSSWNDGPRDPSDPAAGCADLDAWARGQGHRILLGVDEVGRGPLAGPVVAVAVVLPEDHGIEGLDDSKKLSPRRRTELAGIIRQRARAVGVGLVQPSRIDQINIRRATLEAMALALTEVLGQGLSCDLVMVDGLDVIPLPAGTPAIRQLAFVQGDARSRVIGAASIVAKVHRDALMDAYHRDFPVYGFDRHKGYGTAAHREAIARHGPCAIHRRTFGGVKEWCR